MDETFLTDSFILRNLSNRKFKKVILKNCDNERKYLDDKKIVKIGSTQNIKERMSHMNGQFENIEIVLIDIIEINNYRKFEKYLHNDDYIKTHLLRYKLSLEYIQPYLELNPIILELGDKSYFSKIINYLYPDIQIDCVVSDLRYDFNIDMKHDNTLSLKQRFRDIKMLRNKYSHC